MIEFIHHNQVPSNMNVIYATFVCDYRLLKSEPWQVRIVVEGNKLSCNNGPSSQAALLLESKILLNNNFFDTKHRGLFMSLDVKDYFLAAPMLCAEYMKCN